MHPIKPEYAFPQSIHVGEIGKSEGGLTLRDYFAAAAMIAPAEGEIIDENQTAEWCYLMADAMLKARAK